VYFVLPCPMLSGLHAAACGALLTMPDRSVRPGWHLQASVVSSPFKPSSSQCSSDRLNLFRTLRLRALSARRINTCKSVTKQTISIPFRINTYEKKEGGGSHLSSQKLLSLLFHSFALSRFIAPLFSRSCALFFSVSPRNPFQINHPRTLSKNTWGEGVRLTRHPTKGVCPE
jgi:hypothetical protein